MEICKFNAEGYNDPTAYEAIMNIIKEQKRKTPGIKVSARKRPFMPKVFICSPFAGDTERNAANAGRYCAFATDSGYIPFAPHLFFPQFLDDADPEKRGLGIFMGTVFLDGCREVWVFGDTISSGMAIEISRAKHRGLAIRYFTDKCEEVQPHA